MQDVEINKVVSERTGDIIQASLSKDAKVPADIVSNASSFGIGIALTFLGYYLATKKRDSTFKALIKKNVD